MDNYCCWYKKTLIHKSAFFNFWANLKILLLVILAFRSMEPYFFWGKGILTVAIVLMLIFVQFMQLFYSTNKIKIQYSKIIPIFICYSLFYVYKHLIWSKSIKEIIVSFIAVFIPIIIFIICSEDEKRMFIEKFTTFLSIILFLSLIEYLLVITGVLKITPIKIQHPTETFYKYFDNYKLFIVVFDLRNFFIPRFQSIFTEPGHLGMMGALLLYANSYKLKNKRVFIIFLSTLFTMSLASYVLLLTGFFIYKYCSSNKKVLMAIGLSIIALFIILGSVIYYKAFPDSEFSTAIIARLMPDEEKGIVGNNRTTPAFKKAYAEQMSEVNKDSLFGYGPNAIAERIPNIGGNSSGSCFIFMYGIFGGVLLSCFYLSIVFTNYTNVAFGMLLLFFISFLQRPYATWFAQISLMLSATVNYKNMYYERREKLKCLKIK